ncbi:hypothetical protein PpBr36_09111 [Pyricularia pennisetigena]|uniref:hypothetical protein n=1 Tax=Pyricularia pennisetigena TaxID=1578925 RepID=UPI00114D6BEF|nr:hypothetical protein PpBr36_09111 [Pyricularia pennisetigena]TLS24762.1 hypothetical protein PpBr36_09111 [Pyricularia pennisetigena]
MSYNPYMGFDANDYGYYVPDQPCYEQPSGSAAPMYVNPASLGPAPRLSTSTGAGQGRTTSSSRSGSRSSSSKHAGSSSTSTRRAARSAYPPTSMSSAYLPEPPVRPASRSSRRDSLLGMYPPTSMSVYDPEPLARCASRSGRRESLSGMYPPTSMSTYDSEPLARSASRSGRRESSSEMYPPTSMSTYDVNPPVRSASRSGRRESFSGTYHPPTLTTQHLLDNPSRPTSRSGHGQSSDSSRASKRSSRTMDPAPDRPSRSHRRSAEVPARAKSPKPSNTDAFGSKLKYCPKCGLTKLKLVSMAMCRTCAAEMTRGTLGPGMPTSPSTTPYRPVVDLSASGASRATPYPIPTWYTDTPVLGGTNAYRASMTAPRGSRVCPCGRPNHDNLSIMCLHCQRNRLGRN